MQFIFSVVVFKCVKNLQFMFFMHKILLNEQVINYVCILRILQT